MFAIPGTKRHAYLNENWAAGNVALGASTLERIDEALARHPVRGERYTAEVLKAYGLDQASS
jgi:aryl-alcohol dehydrogenase-like predicted oxidoreductase